MKGPDAPENRRIRRPLPMLMLAAAFMSGIIVAAYSDVRLEIWLVAAILAAIAAILVRRQRIPLLLVAAVFLGGVRFTASQWLSTPEDLPNLFATGAIISGEPAIIDGVAASRPEPGIDAYRFRLLVDAVERKGEVLAASGEIAVTVASRTAGSDLIEPPDIPIGSHVRVACRPIREESMQNPGVRSRIAILAANGIDATCSAKSAAMVEVVSLPLLPSPLDLAAELRTFLIIEFRRLLDPQSAGTMAAAITGDRHLLDKSTAQLFREGGTFHILVISGLHITIIGGILLWISGLISQNRYFQLVTVGGVIWLFSLAVGGDVPVVRAALMMTIFLLGRALYRDGAGANTFALAIILMLLWRPGDIFQASFQLTALSVAAIIFIAVPLLSKLRKIGEWSPTQATPFPPNVSQPIRRVAETLYWNDKAWEISQSRQTWQARILKRPFVALQSSMPLRRIAAFVFEAVVVSLAVQVVMLPLSIWYFHRWMPAAFLMNLWVGPLLAAQSIAAALTVVAAQLNESLAAGFALITGFLNRLMLLLPEIASYSGLTGDRLPVYPGIGKVLYFLYFIPIIAIAAALRRWNPFVLGHRQSDLRLFGLAATASTGLLATILIFHPASVAAPDGRLYVEFLDVGQGDAAFITFPDGRTMLVDGGGRPDLRAEDEVQALFQPDRMTIGESVVSEFIWEKGISHVDYLVASHSDADHFEGLVDAARNFSIGEFWAGREAIENPAFTTIREIAQRRQFTIREISLGDEFEISGVHFRVIWPPAGINDGLSDNDASLIFRITYGRRHFLFTGDAESVAEAGIVKSGADLRSDVVKVPHHGSRTSSGADFITATDAEYAVFSVGRRSIFHHPHPDVVNRWAASGATILVTGRRGAIRFVCDGESLWFTTFTSEKPESERETEP